MRPVSIEMEGFMAYRSAGAIDLSDVDLFALTGPTGSGKSTVIDAMVFALYGKTPRFGGHAPGQVINASADWGRVQFGFTLGTRSYLVARRVERDKGVTEASLIEEGSPIASGSKEVGETVPRILGLDYEHFVRAVVLPQGKFARFLSDTPAQRQDLLRALLDVGLFEQVKVLANQRAKLAEAAAKGARERLERLDPVTTDMIDQGARRLDQLRKAGQEIDERLQDLAKVRAELDLAGKAVGELDHRIGELGKAAPPDGIGELVLAQAEAVKLLDEERNTLEEASSRRLQLSAELNELPEPTQLRSWKEMHARHSTLTEKLEAIDVGRLSDKCRELEKSLTEAQARFDELHAANTAHQLRKGLARGDACPVCSQVVQTVPGDDPAAESELAEAGSAVKTAQSDLNQARSHLDRARGEAETLSSQLGDVEPGLAGSPAPDLVDANLAQIAELTSAVEGARVAESEARAGVETAQTALRAAEGAAADLQKGLIASITRLEAEGPPEPGEDVPLGWQRFDAWRLERIGELEAEQEGARQRVEALGDRVSESTAAVTEVLARFDLDAGDDPKTVVAVAIERQEHGLARMKEVVSQVEELTALVTGESERFTVASALGEHLKANKFEAWVMQEAMDALVIGSNELLATLSGGAYSLDHSSGSFDVIDHFNADQRRSTRSLSGGETFLVSLALSLAMASQLVELSGSKTRLESVFLDEGFGTLDAESLDVVESVLNELAGQGRTVGIVTHVRDLADRMPVRFEVSKGPEGASIDEVRL